MGKGYRNEDGEMISLHRQVTDRIIAQLKAGTVPWRRPWSGQATGSDMPRNAITGRAYSGANVFLLWAAQGGNPPRWLTYKQAAAAGGQVRKGEHGESVLYVNFIERVDASGEKRRIPFLKAYTVFNVAQCDNLPQEIVDGSGPAAKLLSEAERDAIAEDFIASTGAKVNHGGSRAFYRSITDDITLPAFETFRSRDAYYRTAFHELVHWTAPATRCNRQLGKRFADISYSAEELVAELGAAFMCAEFGYSSEHDEGQSAAYIASWITKLTENENVFVTAASAASKAVEFMRGLAAQEEAPEGEASLAA